jgi:cold shock protein
MVPSDAGGSSHGFRSSLTLTFPCPVTGVEVSVENPESPLHFSFDCASCGRRHTISPEHRLTSPSEEAGPAPTLTGRVKFYRDVKGWGAIVSPDLSHDVWVHFSAIDGEGYRAFTEGDEVEFKYEDCWGHQDSWHYRATWARRLPAS